MFRITFYGILIGLWLTAQADSTDWVVEQTNLSMQPILVQSFTRQNSDTMAITDNMIQGMQVIYDGKESEPKLKKRWQHIMMTPTSKLTLVGKPDYPFPDRWPWACGNAMPLENRSHAQKYSDFKHGLEHRLSIVYQINNQFHLYGFDVDTGNIIVDLDISKLIGVNLIEDSSVVSEIPELTTMDVFYDHRWHSVLIGVVGARKQVVFCLDVTYPFLLSSDTAQGLLLWHWIDEQGTFTQPTVIRGSDNTWQLIVGQILSQEGKLHIIQLKSGKRKQSIIIPLINANQNQSSIQFLPFIPIDAKSKGYADCVYVSDTSGIIRRFDLQSNKNYMLFSMDPAEYGGEILTQPKVVVHPEKGVIITFLAKYNYQDHAYLISLWDNGHKGYHFSDLKPAGEAVHDNWYRPVSLAQKTLSVRSHRVVSLDRDQRAVVYDLPSGKLHREVSYHRVGSVERIKATDWIGEPLIFHDNKDNHSLLLHTLKDEGYAWAKLDLESDQLGRRTWRQK